MPLSLKHWLLPEVITHQQLPAEAVPELVSAVAIPLGDWYQ